MDITAVQLRDHYETDLSDVALTRLLAAARQEIVDYAGPLDAATQTVVEPASRVIWLRRRAASITSVHERAGGVETALAADDYRLRGPQELVRLAGGPNPRAYWGDEVRVVYVPVSDLDLRRRVQIDLVKLAAQYSATASERTGETTIEYRAVEDERLALLRVLSPGLGVA